KLVYPSTQVSCTGKTNPNIVMIVVKDWKADAFSLENMPLTYHMKRHGISFNKHYNVATDIKGGIFSLLYSLPSSYMSSASNSEPALYAELKNRKYESILFGQQDSGGDDTKLIQQFRDWIGVRTGEEINS